MDKSKIVLMHNIPNEDIEPIYADLLHYIDQHWAACSDCKHYFKRSDYHVKICPKCRRIKAESNKK